MTLKKPNNDISCVEKVSCILFFNVNFNIIMTFFRVHHFLFYLCDKCNVIISKVHYESTIFLEFIHILKYDSH
jgi:hypothetical protein